MIRRAFRRGLTLGLLAGAVASAVKVLRGRRPAQAPADPPTWAPIPGTAPVVVPEPAVDVAVAPGPDPQPGRPAPPPPDPARVAALQETPAPADKPPAKKRPAARKATKKATKGTVEEADTMPAPPWVEPVDGGCPGSHPVKGKLSSRIFHVPGGFNYPRTKPDRCYLDAAAAEADGLRASKR